MIIVGRLGAYDVRWSATGFSYAQANVYPLRKYIDLKFFKIEIPRRALWKSSTGVDVKGKRNYPKDYLTAKHSLPDELREWFNDVVREYENYKEAWEREYEDGSTVSIAIVRRK
jgi:hypothetical protein